MAISKEDSWPTHREHTDLAGQMRAMQDKLHEAEAEVTLLKARIARAQARLDSDPLRQPDYLALSADLRGEVGRMDGVPQCDKEAPDGE